MKLSVRMTLVGAALSAAATCVVSVSAQAVKEKDSTKIHTVKASQDLIIQQQLQSRTFSNAYAAIEALHSNWLRVRNLNPASGSVINPAAGATATSAAASAASPSAPPMPRQATGIQVYLDGVRAGGIDVLKTIPVATIYTIRRISGIDAQARFGIGHSDGVIYVATGPEKGGI
ncbi:MAG: hypothetical protein ABJB74_08220 [Gemmatimonas sp.]